MKNSDKSTSTACSLGQIGAKQGRATEACEKHVARSDDEAEPQGGLKCGQLIKVAVLGAGTMGRGIAQWFAQVGVHTQLTDASPEVCSRALERIFESWERLCSKGKFSSEQIEQFRSNLKAVKISEFDKKSDLVIEAIVENLEIKRSVFQKLDAHFESKTVFASNTSSLSLTQMSEAVSPSRKKRFLGLHFFNPATIMKLVEVVQTPGVDEKLTGEIADWFLERGKKPALCRDHPGFIVNRLARHYYGEALRIVEREDPELIQTTDQTLRQVGGFPMGPFELMDFIGIDINYTATESVWRAFDQHPRFAPHPLQKSMLDQGRTGRKSDKGGFYATK